VNELTACGALVSFAATAEGVNGAETGMHSSGKLIQDVEQIARELGGHDANLLMLVVP
jgi:hypothetical protein